MDALRTGIVGVAAVALAAGELFAGAGDAHADDYGYLSALRGAGIFIHKDVEPYVLKQGHSLCNKLHAGVPPDQVAAEYPALEPAVFLPILRDNLCPNAPG